MAYDDRYPRGRRDRDRWRDESWSERASRWWRGDWRDDPRHDDRRYDDGDRRYVPGAPTGYGAQGDFYGPRTDEPGISSGGPGFDAGFGAPRFDRIDVGSVGSHAVHPISSPSNPAYGFGPGYGSSARAYAMGAHDPHYSEWRRRQIDALDRDYDDYIRENQSRFDREFGAWRSRRGAQREAVGRVTEHMEVVGSDGTHVGTVDKVRGDTIILTRSDPSAGGVHHAIPCGWIDRVEDKVMLNIDAEEARERWRTESRSRALFERVDRRDDGPHILNRSFSGTYTRDDE